MSALSVVFSHFPRLALALISALVAVGLGGALSLGVARAGDLDTAKLPLATADAVSLDDGVAHATLAFNFSQPVDATAFVLANPDRVVIDMPEVDFAIDPQTGTANRAEHLKPHQRQASGKGLVASYRFGLLAPGKSRIVIDLTQPVRIVRAVAAPPQNGVSRFVIELARTDRA
ncbi:MAG TPA: AMIN domain-containing protein, partial [Methylovirgula sp.]